MQITPTIFIGLGSTGTDIVAEIAREVFAASKDQNLHGLIRYFAIETAAISGLRSVHHLPSAIETFGIATANVHSAGAGALSKVAVPNDGTLHFFSSSL